MVKREMQTQNTDRYINTPQEELHEGKVEGQQQITSRKQDIEEKDTFSGEFAAENHTMHCKRKPNWNLEDIVLKLKKSRNSDDSLSTGSMSPPPHRNEAELDDDDEYDNLQSPVYPKHPYVDDKFFSQKSSFLTQLEQKDDLEYLNSVRNNKSLPTVMRTTDSDDENDRDNERDSVSSSDGDNENDGDNGGDEQLNQLLEEEVKLAGDDKIPETRCKKCNKKFYRRTQLIRHLSNHVMHECLHCKAIFYCVKKYKKHMATHETYPCEFCNQEFYDASAWYQHRAKHTMVECNSCDMVFYNKTALTKHKFEHLEYICPLCHLSLENLHYWIAHKNHHARHNSLRLVRGNSSFLSPVMACRICNISFITQDVFLKHKCPGKHNNKTNHNTAIKTIHSKTNLPVPKERRQQTGFRIKEIRSLSRPSYRHHPRLMNKKDINDMIGVDHTLACSS